MTTTYPPAPADATAFLTDWALDSDEPTATLSRVFHGTARVARGDYDISVTITGTQYADGTVERNIAVGQAATGELDAGLAHALARALIAAAAELDGLVIKEAFNQ
jgi:hypothetical protein